MGVAPSGDRRCHLRLLQISGKSVEVGLLPRLPATLSLASPMVRSRLPVPSLLGLFGALLMLLLDLPGYFSDASVTDPEVQEPLAAALEKYNGRSDSANYFKVQSLRKARYQVGGSTKLYLKVEMVKTTCEKKGDRLTYEKIQKCEQLPGIQAIRSCTFIVTYHSQNNEKFIVGIACP